MLSFLLFIAQEAAVLRSFFLLGQFEISRPFLLKRLNSLIDRIEFINYLKMSVKKLDKFIYYLLNEYNSFIKFQKTKFLNVICLYILYII